MNKPFIPYWKPAPKMTRAHFHYIAEVIQELEISEKKRKQIAYKFASALMRTNNRFKYQQFVDYATQKPKIEA